MITDPESDGDVVMEFVSGLMSRLEGLQKKAFTYKSYQKNFKVNFRCDTNMHIHVPLLVSVMLLIMYVLVCCCVHMKTTTEYLPNQFGTTTISSLE